MKKVCVIGGAGFLGSHVADALSDSGYKVCIYDRSPSPWRRVDQDMILGDILDITALHNAIEGAEVVYNFAALADLNLALEKPLETAEINVLGNVKVLEACRKNKIKRFVYASTMYVYSREGGFYRCSKQAAEGYVEEYQRAYGLDYTILRFGSLYGPRSGLGNGLYRMVKQVLDTGKLRYEGSPDALREYIHVTDAAIASVAALGKDFCNQSVVLTGQEPMRVLDLLGMIGEILAISKPVELIAGEQPGHYVRTPYAYQSKLGRKYIPPMHVDLGQGLIELIESVQNNALNSTS
jgi:UDP-glucose 4-epimerase